MPSINKILHDESINDGTFIRMYPEGIFYKAYERSAWLACLCLGELTVKKKYIKKVNMDIVSVGFPITSLEKWTGNRNVEMSDGYIMIYLTDEETEHTADEFEKWKAHIESKCENDVCSGNNISEEIYSKIRQFPLENKTPIECVMFLAQLKSLINSNN